MTTDPLLTDLARELTMVEGLVVDDETGEVIEWPAEMPALPVDRVKVLQAWARGAQQSERDSKTAYDLYRRIIGNLLSEANIASLTTEQGKALRVADGTTRKAPAPQVRSAQEAELLTAEEAMDLLIRAAKELDVEAVEAWVAGIEDEQRRAALKAVLVIHTHRSGYVRLYPPAAPKPPRVTKVVRKVPA